MNTIKSLTLTCVDCHRTKTFAGDVESFMKQIDKSGWHDFPTDTGVSARCPECDQAYADEMYRWE